MDEMQPHDLIFVTRKQYKMFYAHGKVGMEAMYLYLHLMFTAREQETNQVWANENYLKNLLRAYHL